MNPGFSQEIAEKAMNDSCHSERSEEFSTTFACGRPTGCQTTLRVNFAALRMTRGVFWAIILTVAAHAGLPPDVGPQSPAVDLAKYATVRYVDAQRGDD